MVVDNLKNIKYLINATKELDTHMTKLNEYKKDNNTEEFNNESVVVQCLLKGIYSYLQEVIEDCF